MKFHHIHYKPVAYIGFTLAECAIMLACAQAHYDHVCKSAAVERDRDGRPGLCCALLNYTKNTEENHPYPLTFRDIDTLAKILEVGRYALRDTNEAVAAWTLGAKLSGALHLLNASAVKDRVVDSLLGSAVAEKHAASKKLRKNANPNRKEPRQ